jgi:hypothetical protein
MALQIMVYGVAGTTELALIGFPYPADQWLRLTITAAGPALIDRPLDMVRLLALPPTLISLDGPLYLGWRTRRGVEAEALYWRWTKRSCWAWPSPPARWETEDPTKSTIWLHTRQIVRGCISPEIRQSDNVIFRGCLFVTCFSVKSGSSF